MPDLYHHVRKAKHELEMSGHKIQSVDYPGIYAEDMLASSFCGGEYWRAQIINGAHDLKIEGIPFNMKGDGPRTGFIIHTDNGPFVFGIAGYDTLEVASYRLRLAYKNFRDLFPTLHRRDTPK